MNTEKTSFMKEIENYTNNLKLSGIKNSINITIEEANKSNYSYEKLLFLLLQKEHDLRQQNLLQSRLRMANFPYKKYIEDLVIGELPMDAQNKLKHLNSLKFIEHGQNVILSGNPGTEKTHISIALGVKACLEGYKVLFTTVPLFITQLKELPNAIKAVYPNVSIQNCIVHQIRNSLKYIASKDKKDFIKDLKTVYRASTEKLALTQLDNLKEN